MVTVTLASADALTWGGGGGGTWTSLDYPWMVTVTLASADTLTWCVWGGGGGVRPWTIHGCFSGFHRYSNVGLDIPGLSVDGHTYNGHTLTFGFFVPVKSWVTAK